MSNEFQMAASDLRKVGAWLRGLISMADKLESVGSLEQAIKEAEDRRDAADARAKEANQEREGLLAEITQHQEYVAKARSAVDVATAQAVKLRTDAQADVDLATAQAAKIRTEAQADTDANSARAAELAAWEDRLGKWEALLESRAKKLAQAAAEVM